MNGDKENILKKLEEEIRHLKIELIEVKNDRDDIKKNLMN